MKRSLPCLDLLSMQDENPLLSLMGEHMKFWDDDQSLLADDSSVSSNKKRRLAPLVAIEESPATNALEQFLRFAVEETTEAGSFPSMDSMSSIDSCESYLLSKPCSLMMSKQSKPSYHLRHMSPTSILDVTRGMAQISASH
jgi:hypothetical protein